MAAARLEKAPGSTDRRTHQLDVDGPGARPIELAEENPLPPPQNQVAPGHEDQGYLELPGGASGHPLSPYYRAGFDAWARGKPAPLQPGPTQHRLTLQPGRGL